MDQPRRYSARSPGTTGDSEEPEADATEIIRDSEPNQVETAVIREKFKVSDSSTTQNCDIRRTRRNDSALKLSGDLGCSERTSEENGSENQSITEAKHYYRRDGNAVYFRRVSEQRNLGKRKTRRSRRKFRKWQSMALLEESVLWKTHDGKRGGIRQKNLLLNKCSGLINIRPIISARGLLE